MQVSDKQITILIVDDHKLFREGVKRILEMEEGFEVVGEASDGVEGCRLAEEMKPAVVLMDINMPNINGVEATAKIRESSPESKIIILSIHDDENYVFQTLLSGASGYLLKDVDTSSLVDAVRCLARGECYVHPKITGKLIDEFRRLSQPNDQQMLGQTIVGGGAATVQVNPADKRIRSLTSREQQVLRLMASGYNNKQIGLELRISEKTVKNHVSSILQKFEVQDRLHAVVLSVKSGWVKI